MNSYTVNTNNYLNTNHFLARDLELWWLGIPQLAKSYTWIDLSTKRNDGIIRNVDLSTTDRGWLAGSVTNTGYSFKPVSSQGKITANTLPRCVSAGSNAFTCSVWTRRASTGALGVVPACESASVAIAMFGYISGAHVGYIGSSSNRNAWATTSSDISWIHYIYVYDGTQTGNDDRLVCYKNGVRLALLTTIGTIPSSIASSPSSFSLFQGGSTIRSSTLFVDDIKLYSRAFSSSDAALLYLESRNGNPNLLNRIPQRMWVPSAAPSGNRRRRVICGGLV